MRRERGWIIKVQRLERAIARVPGGIRSMVHGALRRAWSSQDGNGKQAIESKWGGAHAPRP